MTDLWGGLAAPRHIDREKAVLQLEKKLKSTDPIDTSFFNEAVAKVRTLIASDAWEARYGGFSAAKVLVSMDRSKPFEEEVLQLALEHLDDTNTHVRLAVAECFFALAQVGGDRVVLAARQSILKCIEDSFEGDAESREAAPDEDAKGDVPSPSNNVRANPAQSGVRSMYRPHSWAKKGELMEAMGSWQTLETSLKLLQRLLDGAAESAMNHEVPRVTPEMRAAVRRALTHGNRFVRETGFYTLLSILGEGDQADAAEIAELLALGLADNWSQVRYAASVANRAFFSSRGSSAHLFYSTLLPPMCLNRHYIAEGVRIYSQETWKIAMGTKGRDELAKIAPETVEFYVLQSASSNYAVREAACHCMGELVTKVEPASVKGNVKKMLEALLGTMQDGKWPVREAACAASGQCVLVFPDESRDLCDQLLSTWLALLRDGIPSVRESAAVAIGKCTAAYKEDVLQQVLSELRTLLPQAKQQPPTISLSDARNGAPESVTPADSPSQTNGEEVCPDELRCGEPWEASEGAIYLLRELSAVFPSKVSEFLPTLAELGHCTRFAQFPDLLDTLWKQLPTVAKNMGKKTFKAYLELFLDPLFWALTCRQRLAESAAGYCISELQQLIGPTIFRARLDEHQRAALDSSPFVGLPALQAQSAAINRTIIKSATPMSPGLQFGAPIIMSPPGRPN